MISRPAGPGPLHYHRGQSDVAVDLQACDVFERSETVSVRVCLHPIVHNPEGVIFTTDGHLKRKVILQSHT